jgi:hypothetical protein
MLNGYITWSSPLLRTATDLFGDHAVGFDGVTTVDVELVYILCMGDICFSQDMYGVHP